MNLLKALFTQKTDKPCGLCGGKIEGKPAFVQYKFQNEETHELEHAEMQVCSACADILDEQARDLP